jgi:hemolysin activation/secretion protein
LIGNEQFLMGGATTVRGYLEGEAAGDRGERIALELRSPERGLDSLVSWFGRAPGSSAASSWRWTGLGFAEYVQLHTLGVGGAGSTSVRLGGVGLGLRIAARQHWVIELDAAQALYDGPSTLAGSQRIHARVVYND